ncbi:hypothetical protein GIB67_001857 [Kingdonia uniflora]|uniref:Uncharacterized protein n=1 Tax=Kingdonia uniflora TaxID=39325 RepID=A0A7J7LQB0_9MAGN|nr:hypothetical protein GIB67_001857 [Kingdonia uniflora]
MLCSAFCNPADVESFTEDKKKSLLVKRQGRGADYVHALQEIVVCFDKLKEQDHGDEVNFGDETTISHAENLDDSVDKAGEMCPIQSPSVLIPYPTLERIYDSTERCDLRDPVEVQEAVKHDVETTSEEPAKNAVCVDSYKETTLAAINTIRKPKDTPIESCDIQKQVPFRKFRNVSSRVDPCKFQVGIKKTDDVVPRAILYEAASRKLRIRKSPDGFDLHDMELSPGVSSTFPSNNSSEDNDFDTFSLAKPCRLESTCKSEQPEVVELLEKGVQLRERLHFQSKTVVLKRKRKPNRKRVAHDAETITASPAEEAGIEISVIETIQNPPPPCERIRECCPKADGDEHLPLVKRARVRMSKLPLQEKEQSDFISAEEKSSAEAPLNHSVPVSSSFDHATKFHPETEPHSWTAKIYQLRACSVDGEAALPPSKRLHRALEAMSANAAEEIQAYNELHYASKVICGNDCSDSSEKCSSNTAMGNVAESFLKVRNMKSDESGPAQNTCGSSPSLPSPTSEVSEKSSSAIKPCGLHIRHSFTPEHEDCKDMLNEDRNVEDSEVVKDTSLNNTHTDTEIKFEGLRPSSNYDEKQEGGLSSGLDYFNQSPSVKENKHGILGTRTHSCESIRDHTASLSNPKGTDSVSEGKEVVSPLEATDVLLSAANEWSSENTKSLICPSHDKVKSMSEVVKEVNHKVRQVDRVAPSYNTSSLKGLIAVAHAKRHSSHSASLCDHMLDDMSPSLIQREDSYEQVSSPSSIICHSSTVDSAGYLLHSSAGSPDILPCHKKTTTVLDMDLANMELSLSQKHKSLTEWKVEANAVQKSFESMLKALSRTKESIGRATRLAIDCLKYGITGEVSPNLLLYFIIILVSVLVPFLHSIWMFLSPF